MEETKVYDVRRDLRDIASLVRLNRRHTELDRKPLDTLLLFLLGYRGDIFNLVNVQKIGQLGDYGSEVERRRAARIVDPEIRELLRDKLEFPRFLNDPKGLVARNLFLVSAGQLRDPGPDPKALIVKSELKNWPRRIVVKPRFGVGGRGVRVFNIGSRHIAEGTRIIDPKDFLQEFDGHFEYVGCEFISQHPFIESELYPHATNTARVLTYIDRKSGKARIADAVMRIGTDSSAPVDNLSAGGITARIEIGSGRLSAAGGYIRPESREAGKVILNSRHPDTWKKIRGFEIPNWKKIKTGILAVCQANPDIEFAGWDVVVTKTDCGFAIIEVNPDPGFNGHQIHGGLLKDQQFRAYLKGVGVLMRRRRFFEGRQ